MCAECVYVDGYGCGVVMGAWLRQGNVRQARAILHTGSSTPSHRHTEQIENDLRTTRIENDLRPISDRGPDIDSHDPPLLLYLSGLSLVV